MRGERGCGGSTINLIHVVLDNIASAIYPIPGGGASSDGM